MQLFMHTQIFSNLLLLFQEIPSFHYMIALTEAKNIKVANIPYLVLKIYQRIS